MIPLFSFFFFKIIQINCKNLLFGRLYRDTNKKILYNKKKQDAYTVVVKKINQSEKPTFISIYFLIKKFEDIYIQVKFIEKMQTYFGNFYKK